MRRCELATEEPIELERDWAARDYPTIVAKNPDQVAGALGE